LKKKRAFSLLEILLGSILFSTVLVYLAGIWGVHARTIGHTRDRMVATFIAGQQIENCITAGYQGVGVLAALGPRPEEVRTTINGVTQIVVYTYTITAASHPDPLLATKMKIITVTVQYTEKSKIGGKSEIVYRTILSDI